MGHSSFLTLQTDYTATPHRQPPPLGMNGAAPPPSGSWMTAVHHHPPPMGEIRRRGTTAQPARNANYQEVSKRLMRAILIIFEPRFSLAFECCECRAIPNGYR